MLSRCPKSLPCLLSSQCLRSTIRPISRPIIVPSINRPIDFPPLSLARNPDEAIRITRLAAEAGGAYPADKIHMMLRECSVPRNRELATQWGDALRLMFSKDMRNTSRKVLQDEYELGDALRLIFSKDMRNTSRKVLRDEYEYASMAAGPMYEPPGPSVYRLGILLDVAPNILVNYTHALVCRGYV